MKWEMEMEEIEAVLEKIWDLHDKLSDAIHSISRAHYLHSIKSQSLGKSDDVLLPRKNKPYYSFHNPNNNNNNNNNNDSIGDGNHRTGFVFVKDFPVGDDDDYSAIHEAKSLDAIRTALENLEDQLEFFHTVQMQQRAERDAAVARLEQSRIVLAMRLSEHQGKKYKVIEEALAFVGDVRDASRFVSPDNLYGSSPQPSGENFKTHEGKRSSNLIKVLVSGFNFAKRSLKLDQMGGILGNAALVAISMIALLHLQREPCKDRYALELPLKKVPSRLEGSSSSGRLTHLDVLFARG